MSSDAVELAGIAGRRLRAVRFEFDEGRIVLDLEGRSLCFEGVLSSTLLGPWDGSPARVEWLRPVHRDDERWCFELRVQYREVPRVYRLVCSSWSAQDA